MWAAAADGNHCCSLLASRHFTFFSQQMLALKKVQAAYIWKPFYSKTSQFSTTKAKQKEGLKQELPFAVFSESPSQYIWKVLQFTRLRWHKSKQKEAWCIYKNFCNFSESLLSFFLWLNLFCKRIGLTTKEEKLGVYLQEPLHFLWIPLSSFCG